MNKTDLITLLEDSPVIAAVKDTAGLERCLTCGCNVVFVLFGDVVTIKDMVERIKTAGKAALVHIDLIDGLAAREVAVDFIAGSTRADGIISTKSSLIRRAKAVELLAVQRFFLLDSIALQNIQKQLETESADLIEVLPGAMPKVVRRLSQFSKTPVITGGLISDKEDVMAALSAGAAAVSSTSESVWFL